MGMYDLNALNNFTPTQVAAIKSAATSPQTAADIASAQKKADQSSYYMKLYGDPNLPVQPDYFQGNTDVLDMLRQRALGTEQSPWAKLMQQQQGLEEQNARDALSHQSAANLSGAFSSLASRGGLSSGARSGLARQALRDQLFGNQNIVNQGMQNRLGINLADEQNRMDIQKGVATADMQDAQNRNSFMQGNYAEQMKAWAANKQAEATKKSGK